MVISKNNFIDQLRKTREGRIGILKRQAQVHSPQACGREEEGTHRSLEGGATYLKTRAQEDATHGGAAGTESAGGASWLSG
jgi:hypothetical protein